ncbi:putative serine/threonine-protein kinase At1g01540 [Tasmannia lanceolata]|uniref:putative serine/threonine-protein kinase At1g01540 n=1 Tax=Tasmannia lanceolata TaxID=3420 RepID=UPI004063BF21
MTFLDSELSKPTFIFGLPLWVLIGISTGSFVVLILFLLSLYLTCRRRKSEKFVTDDPLPFISNHTQDIVHVAVPDHWAPAQSVPETRIDFSRKAEDRIVLADRPFLLSDRPLSQTSEESGSNMGSLVGGPMEVLHLGWGHWFTVRELEDATGGFSEENVIREGGSRIVYYGVLKDKRRIAVKNLLNIRGQAEKDFKLEIEMIDRVRHKNLVRLLGCCVEGAYRMLVYEYVDNGNLDQWLHGDVRQFSPLTWEIRMNIILGIAKGLAYLHEGLEPKVIHRDLKSSNILLAHRWNPKIINFGLAKLLCSERSYVTTRIMGTFGYVAPEYASTGMLNERSDIYSFGVLIMEIISGRRPVDYSRLPEEVNLVEWLKTMVGNRKTKQVMDPRIPEKPSSKALKRALLVALRCVDPEADKRPKMGHVVHMLEVDVLLFRDDRHVGRGESSFRHDYWHEKQLLRLDDKQSVEASGTSEGESIKDCEVLEFFAVRTIERGGDEQ